MRLRRRFVTFVSSLALPLAGFAQTYLLTDMGLLSDGPAPANLSNATGINYSGQVSGYAVPFSSSHAVSYANGTMTDLGTFGGPRSFAQGINDSGTIVGYASVSNLVDHAFSYANGTKTDLGTLPGGGTSSYAAAINSSGVIVGNAYLADNFTRRAFIYANGTMTALAPFSGTGANRATAINDLGQIAGTTTLSGSIYERAFFYNGTSTVLLGFSGGTYSFAYGINNSGRVVGEAYTSGGAQQLAFLFNGESVTSLGALAGATQSAAFDINNAGQIVGRSATDATNNTFHAVMFSGGQVIDLNNQLTNGSGWVLTEALAINDRGQIVGNGIFEGRQHGFILTAIPEPSTYALLAGAGVLAIVGIRRRRASL